MFNPNKFMTGALAAALLVAVAVPAIAADAAQKAKEEAL